MNVEPLDAGDFFELDRGIRQTVRWLREHGFETTDSGDGKSKPAEWYEPNEDGIVEALDVPNVVIVIAPQELEDAPGSLVREAKRLCELIMGMGLEVVSANEDREGVTIEASFDPTNGIGVIILLGLDDEALLGAAVRKEATT